MKPFFWTKIMDRNINPTIWKGIDDSKVEINTEELTDLFGATQSNVSPLSQLQQTTRVEPQKPKIVDLIDSNKSKSVAIFLSRIKMNHHDIVDHILQLDDALTEDQLEALKANCPTPSDFDLIKNYDGDPNLLGIPEKFFKELMRVDNLRLHIDFLLLFRQFSTVMSEITKPLDEMGQTFEMFPKSEKLKKFLSIILKVGNFMNGGSPRGGAYGFKIDTLGKLKDVRSKNPRFTLLHYVCETCENNYPKDAKLALDFPYMHNLPKYDFETIGRQLSEITGFFLRGDHYKTIAESKMVDGDMFYPRFVEFKEETKEEVERAVKMIEEVNIDFEKTLKLFGESTDTYSFADFVQMFNQFLIDSQNAEQDLLHQKEEVEKKKKQEEILLKKEQLKRLYLPQRGVLDTMVNQLMEGSGLKQGTDDSAAKVQNAVAMIRARRAKINAAISSHV